MRVCLISSFIFVCFLAQPAAASGGGRHSFSTVPAKKGKKSTKKKKKSKGKKKTKPSSEAKPPQELKGPKAKAKKLFEMGVQAFVEGNYPDALLYFKESYELNPKLNVLKNIGMCQRELFDFKGAVETLEQYLIKGSGKISKKNKKEIQDLVKEMKVSLGKLSITINENDAKILIDSEEVGISPLQIILDVNPGQHVVDAEKEGFMSETQTVTVKSGEQTVVSLTLIPIVPGVTVEEEDEGKKKKRKKLKKWQKGVLWGVLGAVLAGGGAAAGVLIWQNMSENGTGPSADWTINGR